MTLLEHVAHRIRSLRTSYAGNGISQEALGRELGVATNTVSRWETGAYKPALEDLERLSRFFNVSVLEFFPTDSRPQTEELGALLRAAGELSEADVIELRRYAEFKRAQKLYKGGAKPTAGRKRKVQ
ncbi:MAG: helix-turn-helix transcriptional regulator [bacterium]|nr:helix-turn-helix transcriptional regulator [bacterium]